MKNYVNNNWMQEDAPDRMELVFAYRFKEYGAFQIRKQYARNKLWAMGIAGLLLGILSILSLVGFQRAPDVTKSPSTHINCKLPAMLDTFQLDIPQLENPKGGPSSGKEGSDLAPTIDPAAPDRPFNSGLNGDGMNGLNGDNRGDMEGLGSDSGVLPGNKFVVADTQVYKFPESEAVFPPNEDAFRLYVQDNFVVPMESIESGMEGYALVQFMVNRNGRVSHVRIIESNNSTPDFSREVIRVIQQSPRWIPAMVQGKAVNSWREIPVRLVF